MAGDRPGPPSFRPPGCVIFANSPSHRGIGWNGSAERAGANTVFASISSTGSVSGGKMAMPTTSKSRTTTKRVTAPTRAARLLVRRRLPTEVPPVHPGEMLLEEFLKPLGVSQSAFAVRLGVSFPRLNEVVRGKRAVTPDTALRLAQVIGMSADFWLGLQSDWDLWHALRSDDAGQIAKLTPLPRAGHSWLSSAAFR